MRRLPVFFTILLLYHGLLSAETGVFSLRVFPADWTAQLLSAGGEYEDLRAFDRRDYIRDFLLPQGEQTLKISAPGYRPRLIRVDVLPGAGPGAVFDPSWDGYGRETGPLVKELKLDPFGTPLRWLGQTPTGGQPKSVEFFGDGSRVVVSLLMGNGLDIYSVQTGEHLKRVVIPEPYGSQEGFVETAYLEGLDEIWVSQMESGMIHVVDGTDLTYKTSVPAGGHWTKIIIPSPDERYLYTSNWETEDMGIIDTEKKELLGRIPLTGIPRGMAFGSSPDILYVCIFETGNIEKIDLRNRRSLGVLETGPGAARHIVYDRRGRRFFVSDMMSGRVYSFSESTGMVVRQSPWIGSNPNTIKLSPDGRFIFASNRGRNNPETFLKKGPDYGHITVLDADSLRVVHQIWGMNQPTGLGLSEDGKTLVFSDFKDDQVEFYDVSGVY